MVVFKLPLNKWRSSTRIFCSMYAKHLEQYVVLGVWHVEHLTNILVYNLHFGFSCVLYRFLPLYASSRSRWSLAEGSALSRIYFVVICWWKSQNLGHKSNQAQLTNLRCLTSSQCCRVRYTFCDVEVVQVGLVAKFRAKMKNVADICPPLNGLFKTRNGANLREVIRLTTRPPAEPPGCVRREYKSLGVAP